MNILLITVRADFGGGPRHVHQLRKTPWADKPDETRDIDFKSKHLLLKPELKPLPLQIETDSDS
jgi:hypothetical protein